MITRILHVNIVVADVEASMRFYTQLLGARVVRDWWGESETSGAALGLGAGKVRWHAYMLRFGDGDENTYPQIDLLQWIDPPSYGVPYATMNHIGIPRICVEVDDMGATYERLKDAGVRFITEPRPINPRTKRGSITEVCCFYDPDGVVIELLGPLSVPGVDGDR